jgi:predicted ATPase/DNA-binding CsgD family transcriptional regulator
MQPSTLGVNYLSHRPGDRRGNLPVHRQPLFGREEDVLVVRRRLTDAGRGLLTLTGAGGVGKTCLAIEVAAALEDAYADGVWLVELAALAPATLVAQAVAATLGLRERPAHPVVDVLVEFLEPRSILLVLDNCEHLIGACAHLTDQLLSRCPTLRILATSREPLRIPGEVTWRVPSLAVPDLHTHAPTPEELSRYPAVRLFDERARAVRREFTLTGENAMNVAEICARLDGMPLPIELAAARVQVFSVAQIATRLDDAFRLLTGGSRTAATRHQTMRGALDWSHALLTEQEQCLFRRLAVFAGGFDLSAAEAVCSAGDVDVSRLVDVLGQLIEKSLVLSEQGGGEMRYRLLEPIRQYALERLRSSGDLDATARSHARWFRALAEEADGALRGPEQIAWAERLEREHDNLRVALRWYLSAGEIEAALRFGTALWLFWRIRGHRQEGSRWLDEALARADDLVSESRAAALQWSAELSFIQGNYERARDCFDQSLSLWRALGNTRGIARTLCHLGRLVGSMAPPAGDYATAMRLLEESLLLSRQEGDTWGAGFTLIYIASVAREHGDLQPAATAARESMGIYQAQGEEHLRAHAVRILGNVLRDQGDLLAAERLLEESLAGLRHVSCNEGIAESLYGLARLARLRQELERASGLCKEALRLQRQLGIRADMIGGLYLIASIAIASGKPGRAAGLFGAADSQREAMGLALPLGDVAPIERERAATRVALGGKVFSATYGTGRSMPLDTAVDLACAADAAADNERSPLTRRECEVVTLIARGYTNQHIAEALVISERTAEGHVARILAKLGLDTRSSVAVWAVQHTLAPSGQPVQADPPA